MTDTTTVAEADSTINAEVQTVEQPTTESNPQQKNAMKLLSERNKYKDEVKTYKQEVETLRQEAEKSKSLQERITELEGKVVADELNKEQLQKKQDFFSSKPDAKEAESGIDDILTKYPDMDYEDAYSLYLAKNKPTWLVDEQQLNQLNAPKMWIDWVTDMDADKDFAQMSPSEVYDYVQSHRTI